MARACSSARRAPGRRTTHRPIGKPPPAPSRVSGEWYSPTQPFPTKPPAYDRQGLAIDDLIDFTPELRAEAVEIVSRYTIGPIFTPPVVSRWEGPPATLSLPGAGGGSNWPGGSLFMPAPQSGSPMTCMLDGEQYIVLAVSGSNYSGELLAFKLN